MGEPLAATLLSGAVLAMLWAADRRAPRARGWLPGGAARGTGDGRGPSTSAVAVLLALGRLRPRRRRERLAAAALAQAAVLLAGVAVVVAPWTVRNAVALDRFVPISTGGGQVLFAGTYLPSDGDPERVGAEVARRATPSCSGRELPAAAAAAGADPRPRWPPQRYPGAGNRRGALADGARTALGRRQRASRSTTPASSRRRWRGSGRTARAT